MIVETGSMAQHWAPPALAPCALPFERAFSIAAGNSTEHICETGNPALQSRRPLQHQPQGSQRIGGMSLRARSVDRVCGT
jgi:hypothetical protein